MLPSYGSFPFSLFQWSSCLPSTLPHNKTPSLFFFLCGLCHWGEIKLPVTFMLCQLIKSCIFCNSSSKKQMRGLTSLLWRQRMIKDQMVMGVQLLTRLRQMTLCLVEKLVSCYYVPFTLPFYFIFFSDPIHFDLISSDFVVLRSGFKLQKK